MRESDLKRASDHIISNFRSTLAYEMVNLLSFSLALAENNELKMALIQDDEHKGHLILSTTSDRFKQYTHFKSLHLQVLTPDFFLFARSWDEGFEGLPLAWFRDDLIQFKESKTPKAGMETGRMLSFKSTIPIKNKKEIVGYLEAIRMVDEFSAKLQKRGIELFVLMDLKYLAKAPLMKNYPQFHDYIISNKNYNRKLLKRASSVDWKEFESDRYYYKNHTLYLLEPMYNSKRQKIGYYMLALTDSSLKSYYNGEEKRDFFTQFSDDDIYEVVESWHHKYGSFANENDKNLIQLLPNLKRKDKVDLEKEAIEVLQRYNKNDLINIILNKSYQEPKRGVVK